MTDIHLDFITHAASPNVSSKNLDTFCHLVLRENPDGALISGDISLATSLEEHLIDLESRLKMPIYFVLGNHDFWGGSFNSIRNLCSKITRESEYLRYLTVMNYTQLAPSVALVGHDGWYDGLNGDPRVTNFIMNDWTHITDFVRATRLDGSIDLNKILSISRQQARSAANHLAMSIKSAITQKNVKKIIVLTHVPPFLNPHGRNEPELNLWYSSKTLGDMLFSAAAAYPDVTFKVLCGHVHEACTLQITPNLIFQSGVAEYSKPMPQGIIEV